MTVVIHLIEKIDTKTVYIYVLLISSITYRQLPTANYLPPMFTFLSSPTQPSTPAQPTAPVTSSTTETKDEFTMVQSPDKKEPVVELDVKPIAETKPEPKLIITKIGECAYQLKLDAQIAPLECKALSSSTDNPEIKILFDSHIKSVLPNKCNLLFYGIPSYKTALDIVGSNPNCVCNLHFYSRDFTVEKFNTDWKDGNIQFLSNLPVGVNVYIHTSDVYLKSDSAYNRKFHYIIGKINDNDERAFNAVVQNSKITVPRKYEHRFVQSQVIRFVTSSDEKYGGKSHVIIRIEKMFGNDLVLVDEYTIHDISTVPEPIHLMHAIIKKLLSIVTAISILIMCIVISMYKREYFMQFSQSSQKEIDGGKAVIIMLFIFAYFIVFIIANEIQESDKRKFYQKRSDGKIEPVTYFDGTINSISIVVIAAGCSLACAMCAN